MEWPCPSDWQCAYIKLNNDSTGRSIDWVDWFALSGPMMPPFPYWKGDGGGSWWWLLVPQRIQGNSAASSILSSSSSSSSAASEVNWKSWIYYTGTSHSLDPEGNLDGNSNGCHSPPTNSPFSHTLKDLMILFNWKLSEIEFLAPFNGINKGSVPFLPADCISPLQWLRIAFLAALPVAAASQAMGIGSIFN